MFKEFREFALKGNMIDLAVGVVIGTAFGKIVTSLVNDIIMPPIGMLIGNVDFSELKLVLRQAAEGAPAVTLNYGVFINNIVNFMIIGLCIFAVVKILNSLKRPHPAAALTTKECPECVSTIPLKARRCLYCTATVA